MADNRTEKATSRRRQKAREEGQVLRSRELSASLALLTLVMVLAWQPFLSWRNQWRALWCSLLALATAGDLQSPLPALRQVALMAARWALPAVCAAIGVSALASIAQGGLNFSTKALMPKLSRLSPASNLGRIFSLGGLSNTLKTLVPLSFITYLCSGIIARDWTQMTLAAHAAPMAAAAWILSRLFEVSWKASLIFLAWSGLDYMLQRLNYERSLRMTKEEIRQEGKDTEGNPQNKRRIRKMQFKLRRRFRMADVARATVLVTNPTHYAVALEYRPESMAAPVVIAKGRNLLAQQIKQYALWHDVPVVENKPLAQALYKAVEVGQAIPEKLYTVVAEILAFLFRAQQRRLSPQLLRRERT
jgi:flagellar biosynthesis protein FlhB